MKELWKDIKGFERYKISNKGRIKSYCRKKSGELMKPQISKKSLMMDSVIFIEDYLDDRYNRECHYSKTIGEFAKEYPYGKYAVTTNGHITAIIDGIIYDTFDPSDRIMRCAWKIN